MTRLPPQFAVREALAEKEAPHAGQELTRLPDGAAGVAAIERNLRIIIGRQAVIETLPEVRRPLALNVSRPDQVKPEQAPHGCVTFGRAPLNVQPSLGRL